MACKSGNCQFCEESTEVKWHCQSCDLNLCDVCNKKIHSKIDKLSGHKVFLSQHGGQIEDFENSRKVDLKEISCSKHNNKKCLTYCLNCNKSLCSFCLIRPFQYEELSKVYEEKYLLLKDLKSKIDECYPFFEEKAATFKTMDDREVSKHNEIKEKISNRKNEAKNAITKEALHLVEVMEGIWDPENNPVVSERKRLSLIEQELLTGKKTLDEVLETQDPASVFSTVEKINSDIPEKSALDIKPPEWIFLEPPHISLKEVLGSVIRIPKVIPIQTFEVDFPELNGLVSLNADICVMFHRQSRKFKYFTISDSKFVTTNDMIDANRKDGHFAKILDITNFNGEILMSDDQFAMRRLKRNGKFEIFSLPSITKDQLDFFSIHVSERDESFVVGFTNKIGSSAGILEFNMNFIHPGAFSFGIPPKRIEGNSNTFFSLPKKITRNINGHFCVIDQPLNSKTGRIVVIGELGQCKWTYSGHSTINSKIDFSPNDIVTTSSGLVLVAEKTKNAIHVLSKDGQFICNCISDTDITEPTNICFHKGHLMIGCSYSGKTKLYVVDFVE
ncbi:uncharacterized protein LOC143069192 [Mytilus galloprovincialis]|uniref:uncharacterized protein LOC143069192 n=1 Tax=Mytilus galloprovincialis TaxID=29158 RepID=UPI003F7BC6C3